MDRSKGRAGRPRANGGQRERPFRVLLVLHRAGPAGTERHVLWLARGLSARGHRVTIAVSEGGALLDDLRAAAHQVQIVPRRYRTDPLYPILLARLARRLRIDVLHSHGGRMAALAGRLARTPAILETRHGLGPLGEPPSAGRLRREAARCRLARATLTVCETDRERLIAGGLPPSRVHAIANGIPRRRSPAGRQEEGTIRLGFLGRLAPQKDPLFLAAVARRLEADRPGRWSLAVAGDGPLREPLRAALASAGIGGRVVWLGETDGGEPLLSRIDLLLVPSIWEGQPLSVLEAMQAAVVPLAREIPALRELLGGDPPAGVLLPPDPEAWAGAILRLAGDPGRREALAREAARRIETFHRLDAMVDSIEARYRDCFAAAGGG